MYLVASISVPVEAIECLIAVVPEPEVAITDARAERVRRPRLAVRAALRDLARAQPRKRQRQQGAQHQ